MKSITLIIQSVLLPAVIISFSCQQQTKQTSDQPNNYSPLEAYVDTEDSVFRYEILKTEKLDQHTFHVLKVYSQQWLSDSLVMDPLWWHYINLVVPDSIKNDEALMIISGGDREDDVAENGGALLTRAALASGSITAEIRNVPNQPIRFQSDTANRMYEDEIIAHGWKMFLESGAEEKDAEWLARLPMTRSVIKGMDAVTEFTKSEYGKDIQQFVVAGASKRGWTTWTTAIVDPRVKAIVPIVIDVLNLVPSMRHHWRAYGKWAPAVQDYENAGVMEWLNSRELEQLLDITEPFNFKNQLTMPKYIINSAGDQFFQPESWKFYYDQLPGKKMLRYIPNSDHSLRKTDAIQSLISYYNAIINEIPLPDYKWTVNDGVTFIKTDPENPPVSVQLWQAHNPEGRDFRQEAIGNVWQSSPLEIQENGDYQVQIDSPAEGWKAYFVELTYEMPVTPLKVTTGVVVTPDNYQFAAYQSKNPQGKMEEEMVP